MHFTYCLTTSLTIPYEKYYHPAFFASMGASGPIQGEIFQAFFDVTGYCTNVVNVRPVCSSTTKNPNGTPTLIDTPVRLDADLAQLTPPVATAEGPPGAEMRIYRMIADGKTDPGIAHDPTSFNQLSQAFNASTPPDAELVGVTTYNGSDTDITAAGKLLAGTVNLPCSGDFEFDNSNGCVAASGSTSGNVHEFAAVQTWPFYVGTQPPGPLYYRPSSNLINGTYVMRTKTDDGSYLVLDAKVAVDNGAARTPQEQTGAMSIPEQQQADCNNLHHVNFEYYEILGGPAELNYQWKRPGKRIPSGAVEATDFELMTQAVVWGRVVNNGVPVPGAMITISGPEHAGLATDKYGCYGYNFTPKFSGTRNITVAAGNPGQPTSVSRTILLNEGQEVRLEDLDLSNPGSQSSPSPGLMCSATTDAAGVTFGNLCVTPDSGGYNAEFTPIDNGPQRCSDFDFNLAPQTGNNVGDLGPFRVCTTDKKTYSYYFATGNMGGCASLYLYDRSDHKFGKTDWSTPSCQSTAGVIVSVLAAQTWTDTGIILSTNEAVSITASGSLSIGSGYTMTPDGDSPSGPLHTYCLNNEATGGFPAPNLPCWSLIGRIGTGGTPFEVGSMLSFHASSSGELYLGINDNNVSDNSGSWAAQITTTP
jgi:hypothetical protein